MKTTTKKNILLIAFAVVIYALSQMGTPVTKPMTEAESDALIQSAYSNKQTDLQMQGHGIVVKVLPDDLKGSRHQKFILRISSKQTVLVAHNIDVAKRIDGLQKGDKVEFYGEYEWTDRGGVIHWTHFDPGGNHIHGWLRHNGITYQ